MTERRIQCAGGFTLVEIMISLAIASLISIYVGQIYSNTSTAYVHNREKAQVEARAMLVSDFVSQELRNAGYIIGWDATPDALPLAVNQPITGATVDANTESLTVRYAQGPLTGVGATVAQINGAHASGVASLTVQPLTFSIASGTLVAIYTPPSTVNVRRTAAASAVGATTVLLVNPTTWAFNTGSVVAVVQESSFWVQGGQLQMRSSGVNQQIASNVEDLQIAFINQDQSIIGNPSSAAFAGLTNAQSQNVRAVRLSITVRANRPITDVQAKPPPSLEDHDRSGETADTLLRVVEQTTIYLRNFGVLSL